MVQLILKLLYTYHNYQEFEIPYHCDKRAFYLLIIVIMRYETPAHKYIYKKLDEVAKFVINWDCEFSTNTIHFLLNISKINRQALTHRCHKQFYLNISIHIDFMAESKRVIASTGM